MLAAGNRKATVHEAFRGRVELADRDRVFATNRQADQAPGVVWREALRAFVDPVGVLGLRERIEVQQGLPGRLSGAIAGERGEPPDAAHVILVLPEVADAVGMKAWRRRAVLRGQDFERVPPE